ncbi:hypothetical protein DAERI_020053 [Deinococcus aerius]|uniref:VTT domain-containing protein n=2 Tax=Deinococcus TaxID=1298 RepID=A0A2I9D204_9DEIO|nr:MULTISPECIES: DedA family protein [Deinococcus]MBB5293664.1 membrane protein DedA with SNARE-associated domain [Deinococcus metallilatus]QBY07360.1 DedA family protein [Deinococcus metallilatus]RXJ14833.1 DedA family protein [Deinococcus metallilatus]TLK30954.1 DedA family protein [Deinococcus metallilatus]GBF04456.1 hypothetical protein DAERI_020053 [Deinococcus aerius]
MTGWITALVDALGYPGIVLVMFLENIFPPLPSELIMPLAGFSASRGTLRLPGVILAGTLGSVLGALPLYWIGFALGKPRLVRLAQRYERLLMVRPADVERADTWFARRGPLTVLLLRLVPGVRSLISIPAGLARMPLPLFLLLTTLGTAVWTALLTLAGYLLGENYAAVERVVGPLGPVVLGTLVLAVLVFIVVRWRAERRAAR